MKRKILFLITMIISISFIGCTSVHKDETNNKRSIEEFSSLDLNGCSQKLLIQSDDIDNNPVLLYLHGGPGSSLMMYSYLYSGKLKQNYIFVNWDMRGAGLSYSDNIDPETVSEGQIAKDAVTLIHYLMDRFHKKKIYLLGHSFGSVLGMYLVDNYPDLFYAYIGVGQVINYKESVPIVYNWLHDTLVENGDTESLERIEKDHFPYIDLVVKYGGHHNLSLDLNSIIKNSPYYTDGYLDILSKGKSFSVTALSKNPKTFEYPPSEIKETTVPLYFFEGKNDHVIACAPELVVKYCNTVTAPKKEIIWFENSAHLINVEEPEKFQEELVKILHENSKEAIKL